MWCDAVRRARPGEVGCRWCSRTRTTASIRAAPPPMRSRAGDARRTHRRRRPLARTVRPAAPPLHRRARRGDSELSRWPAFGGRARGIPSPGCSPFGIAKLCACQRNSDPTAPSSSVPAATKPQAGSSCCGAFQGRRASSSRVTSSHLFVPRCAGAARSQRSIGEQHSDERQEIVSLIVSTEE